MEHKSPPDSVSTLPHNEVQGQGARTIEQQLSAPRKDSRFWLTFFAVCVSTFLSAVDITAVGTTLPTITKDLNGGDEFSWVGSAYALAATAFLPLSGHLADAFGRRPLMIGSILLFTLGSALAGAAQNMPMLIGARTVQGIGSGGILNLSEIITSDLVPLAERGMFQGLIGLVWAMACGVGPPIGGAFAQSATWRWLFYLNLPLCGIALALVTFFLRVRTPPGTVREKLTRIDWIGNFIVIAGVTMAITGLTFGGIRHPWDSAQVLVPLILGLVTLAGFIVYERLVPMEPSIPWEILSNRTSLSGYIGTFFHGIASVSITYYLPVYFQAAKGAGPGRSGVDILPLAFFISISALIAGAGVGIAKKYRLCNLVGWVLFTVGFGILSLMKADIDKAKWVGYQILAAAGMGVLFTATVFPVLAPLPIERNASALAFFIFIRSFAQTWGITISATILQNSLKHKLPQAFLSQFPEGVEIAYAAIPLVRTLPDELRQEVQAAFADSLAVIWKAMIGFSAAGLVSVALMKEIKLIEHTDERFGLHGGDRNNRDAESGDAREVKDEVETQPMQELGPEHKGIPVPLHETSEVSEENVDADVKT